MNKPALSQALLAMTLVMYGSYALAENPPASTVPGTVPVEKDLAAVIALQGLPCGQVVSFTQVKENDYVASCQDGNRYHVFIDADGRVVAEKQ